MHAATPPDMPLATCRARPFPRRSRPGPGPAADPVGSTESGSRATGFEEPGRFISGRARAGSADPGPGPTTSGLVGERAMSTAGPPAPVATRLQPCRPAPGGTARGDLPLPPVICPGSARPRASRSPLWSAETRRLAPEPPAVTRGTNRAGGRRVGSG